MDKIESGKQTVTIHVFLINQINSISGMNLAHSVWINEWMNECMNEWMSE